MDKSRTSWRRIRSVTVGVMIGAAAWAEPPRVDSVEPPSWWPQHSLNPVRLLLRGVGLTDVRVLSDDPALRPGPARVNAGGTWLFVDVQIGTDATPGVRVLKVVNAMGEAEEVSFELFQPLPRAGRFRGVNVDDVIYLAMPDRFANGDLGNDHPYKEPDLTDRSRPRYYHGGDLKGVTDRLPYLRDLGVTALWLNPWYDNVDHLNRLQRFSVGDQPAAEGEPVTDYHGYHAVDFYAVEEHLGTLTDLRDLVDAAHAEGIKVIQDQVANHSGPYHAWVADPPTPTWYHGTVEEHLDNPWRIWTLPDPHATPALQRATLEGWFANLLPDLNQSDDDCAQYLIQNSLWWIGITGVDAVRQDTLPYVPRTYWSAWTGALKREYPNLNVIGEVSDRDASKVSFFQAGRPRWDGIDSGIELLFDYPLYYPLRLAFAHGQSLQPLAESLARDHLYPDPEGLVTFLGLHDVSRFMSEPGATVEGLKQAFTFLLTTRGIPLIYYGDEIALPGGEDPDNRRDFPGGWLRDPRNAFAAAGRTAAQQEVFAHVQALTALRRSSEALRRGRLLHLAVEQHAYVFARLSPGQRIVVALNSGTTPKGVRIDTAALGMGAGSWLEPWLGAAEPIPIVGPELQLTLPVRAAIVWEWVEEGGTSQ